MNKFITAIKDFLIFLRFRFFPKSIHKTDKGQCLEDYCYKILNEAPENINIIQAYEDILNGIQKDLKVSRTVAVIYVLSVLGSVND